MPEWSGLVLEVAKRRGYRVEEKGSTVIVRHPEAPLALRIAETGRGVEIRLEAEGVDDYLEDLMESSPAPRELLEQHIDDLTELALEVSRILESKGYKPVLRLREEAMDLLERLEELEES